MFTPGFYKTDHRKITFREMIRWYGILRLPAIYMATRRPPRAAGFWMPGLWADLECPREQLSDRFWQATAVQRASFERLGFTEVGVSQLKRSLNLHPLTRDDGKITYLDGNRSCIGLLMYTRLLVPAPVNEEREQVTIAFTCVFEKSVVSSANNQRGFQESNREKVIRLRSDDPATIHAALARDCARRAEAALTFPDEASLRAWFDRNQITRFESMVRRGLFVKMTDEEVAEARSKLPQGI